MNSPLNYAPIRGQLFAGTQGKHKTYVAVPLTELCAGIAWSLKLRKALYAHGIVYKNVGA